MKTPAEPIRIRVFSSLKVRLAFWFAATSIVLTLVLVQVIQLSATEAMRQQIGQKLAELAYQTTDKLDQGMYERYREVELLAGRKEFGDQDVSATEKQAMLDQMQDTYRHYAWIGVTDLNGKVLHSTKGLLVGADVSKRPWFSDALSGIYAGDLHEAKLLAKLLPMVDGEPKRFVDVAFPYKDTSGRIVGVLGVHMSWEWAKDIERSVFNPVRKRSSVEAMIISKDGTVLLGPKALQGTSIDLDRLRAIGAGENRYAVEPWDDGKTYLVGYSQSQGFKAFGGLGWSVLVRQDVVEAFMPVKEIQRNVLWSGLTIALLFSLFGLLNAQRITRPLVQLTASAEKLRSREMSSLIRPEGTYREVQGLAASFTALFDDLQEMNLKLESRVRERTDALAASQQRLQAITDSIPAMIMYIDTDEHCRFSNVASLEWFGRTPEEMVSRTLRELLGEQRYPHAKPYIDSALRGESASFEQSRSQDGELQYVSVNYKPHIDRSGVVRGFYVLKYDITALKTIQLGLQHDVLHDALTGLPNRLGCFTQLQGAITRVNRHGKPLAVMFLDIDHFKQINDSYGHEFGDGVLQEFSRRVRAAVRETDTVARLAGDEFVVILEELVNGEADARLVAEKIVAAVCAPMPLQETILKVTTSLGIAVFEGGVMLPEDLLKNADKAMYDAKHDGRGRAVLFGQSNIVPLHATARA